MVNIAHTTRLDRYVDSKHWFPFIATVQIKSEPQWFAFFFLLSAVQQLCEKKKKNTQAGAEQLKTSGMTTENGNCEACTTWE